jgi:hypothetical protein
MTQSLARPHFHSAQLIRLLAELDAVPPLDAAGDFAERLGQWVGFTDAIHLCAVHNAIPGGAAAPTRPSRSAAVALLAEEVTRVRGAMEQSMRRVASDRTGKSRIPVPVPLLELPLDLKHAFEPYRRYYQAQQREMDVTVAALRAKLRAAAARASTTMQQLCTLDEALESIFNPREDTLLAGLPTLLEKRFKHWFKVHQKALAHSPCADDPAEWLTASGWLTRFGQELQSVLLAELDMRLQPTLGLLEALQNESHQKP